LGSACWGFDGTGLPLHTGQAFPSAVCMAAPLSGRGRLRAAPFFVSVAGWMDRCAVLVDAGYLYAEGGKLCCGTSARGRIMLQSSLAVELLQRVALETTRLPVLRTYWYDGARDGIRTQEQRQVAGLPNVKLRLGRLTNNGQKGVDALIYRDLMTLAQHRAVSDVVLLSGDEDLCAGVRVAQDHGVRVVLVGIPHVKDPNQSPELVFDSDHLTVLGKSQLEPMFTSRSPAASGRPVLRRYRRQDRQLRPQSLLGMHRSLRVVRR
ncbi:MAG: NYN domain-containing protein, partial [Pseudonocardiaceae bacterium]